MELRDFCRLWRARTFRIAAVCLILAGFLFVLLSAPLRALKGSSEFMGFRRIVQVSLVEDQDHYEAISHVRAYPPFFAIAWSPFGAFPVGLVPDYGLPLAGTSFGEQLQLAGSATLAVAVMLGAALVVPFIIARAAGGGADEEGHVCLPALILLLSGGLMLNAVARLETDMLVVLLVAGAMHLMFRSRRTFAAGTLLGIAAAFKLTPGLFGVYLLFRRRWRALIGMVLAGVLCTIVLPVLVWGGDGAYRRHRSWVRKVLVPVAAGDPEFIGRAYRRTNQSLQAAAVRYLTPYNAGSRANPRSVNVADLPRRTVDRIAGGLKLGVLGLLILAWLLPSREASPELKKVLFALVPAGMLLLSDVSVGGHFAIAPVPLAVLAAYCFRHADRAATGRVSLCVLVGFALMNLMAVTWLKELSVATGGILMVYGAGLYLAFRLWRRQKAAETATAG